MSKRLWTIKAPGYDAFSMVVLEGLLDYEQALREARAIWPTCEIW